MCGVSCLLIKDTDRYVHVCWLLAYKLHPGPFIFAYPYQPEPGESTENGELSGFGKSSGSCIPSSAWSKTTCLPRNAKQPPDIYYKRFKIDKLPENFCESDLAQKAITELIHRLESRILSQNGIDKAYDDLCAIYYSQMNVFFRSNDVHPCSRKRLHKSIKPFWSDELLYIIWMSLKLFHGINI